MEKLEIKIKIFKINGINYIKYEKSECTCSCCKQILDVEEDMFPNGIKEGIYDYDFFENRELGSNSICNGIECKIPAYLSDKGKSYFLHN